MSKFDKAIYEGIESMKKEAQAGRQNGVDFVFKMLMVSTLGSIASSLVRVADELQTLRESGRTGP